MYSSQALLMPLLDKGAPLVSHQMQKIHIPIDSYFGAAFGHHNAEVLYVNSDKQAIVRFIGSGTPLQILTHKPSVQVVTFTICPSPT